MSSRTHSEVSEGKQERSITLSDLAALYVRKDTLPIVEEEEEKNKDEAEDVDTDLFDDKKEFLPNQEMSENTCDSAEFLCYDKRTLFSVSDPLCVANNDPDNFIREEEESFISSTRRTMQERETSLLFQCINANFQTSDCTFDTAALHQIYDHTRDASQIQRAKNLPVARVSRPKLLRIDHDGSDRFASLDDNKLHNLRAILASLEPIDAKREVEILNEDSETILHLSCRHRMPFDIIDMLLSISRDVASWACLPEKSTPLHIECENGASFSVIKRLIEAYPDAVAAEDYKGRTPLHLACQNRLHPPSFETLYMLMAPGSDYDVLNINDHSGEYPITMDYLCRKAETIDSDKYDKSPALDCLIEYLNSRLKGGYLPSYDNAIECVSSLDESPSWFREAAVVHPYLKAILNWRIVSNFNVRILFLDCYNIIMCIISFRLASFKALNARYAAASAALDMAVGCSDSPETCHNTYDDSKNISVSIALLYVGATYMALREVMQAGSLMYHKQIYYWLRDVRNWVDCFAIGLLYYTTSQMSNGSVDDDTFRLLAVLTTGFLWIETFSVLKTINHSCAVFITGLAHMALTLRPFLLTLSLVLMAFAQMYLTQYLGTDECSKPLKTETLSFSLRNNFCSATNSYLKVYLMFAGNAVDESEFTNNSTTLILSVIFSFTLLILLLNILIAIVTDSYGELVKKSQVVFWSERMSRIHEIGKIGILYRVLLEKLEILQGFGKDSRSTDSCLATYNNELGEFNANYELGQSLMVLWDIAMLAFEDSAESKVPKIKQKLRRRWKPNTILAKYIDPNKFLSFVVESRLAYLSVIILIPFWILLGFLSAGVLWPLQVKKWLLCPHIKEESENESVTKEDIMKLSDERRQGLTILEDNLNEKWADVHSEIHEVNEGVCAIKNEQKAIKCKHTKMEKEVVKIQMDVDLIRKDIIKMNSDITDIKNMLRDVLGRDDV